MSVSRQQIHTVGRGRPLESMVEQEKNNTLILSQRRTRRMLPRLKIAACLARKTFFVPQLPVIYEDRVMDFAAPL